jgi:hypothetical protein
VLLDFGKVGKNGILFVKYKKSKKLIFLKIRKIDFFLGGGTKN